jgi:hypothetical protein
MFDRTLEGAYSYNSKIWRGVSIEAKDLIDKLLIGEAESRITLEDALKHSWFLKTSKKSV